MTTTDHLSPHVGAADPTRRAILARLAAATRQ